MDILLIGAEALDSRIVDMQARVHFAIDELTAACADTLAVLDAHAAQLKRAVLSSARAETKRLDDAAECYDATAKQLRAYARAGVDVSIALPEATVRVCTPQAGRVHVDDLARVRKHAVDAENSLVGWPDAYAVGSTAAAANNNTIPMGLVDTSGISVSEMRQSDVELRVLRGDAAEPCTWELNAADCTVTFCVLNVHSYDALTLQLWFDDVCIASAPLPRSFAVPSTDTFSGRLVAASPLPFVFESIDVSGDGTQLVASQYKYENDPTPGIFVFRVEDVLRNNGVLPEPQRSLRISEPMLTRVMFTPEGRIAVGVGYQNYVAEYDAELAPGAMPLTTFAVSSSLNTFDIVGDVLVVLQSRGATVFSRASGARRHFLSFADVPIAVQITPCGTRIVTSTFDLEGVTVQALDGSAPMHVLPFKHPDSVNMMLTMLPQGEFVEINHMRGVRLRGAYLPLLATAPAHVAVAFRNGKLWVFQTAWGLCVFE